MSPPGPPRDGLPGGIVGALLVAVSVVAIFVAGLTLGGMTIGRDAQEQSAFEAFLEAYRRINDDFVGEAEPEALVEGAIRGMFETLDDPYSAYMGPEEYSTTLGDISGEFEGIGARMVTEDPDGISCDPIGDGCRLRVIEVLPSTPALEAGLLIDDVVARVDDRSLDGHTVDDAVRMIRGPRGSGVTLTVDRAGDEVDLDITRDLILIQDVRSDVLAGGRVGYLRVDAFSRRADDDFEEALRDQLATGIDRFVVDVRDDPGGFVDTAVDITSQFLDDGAVYWEETSDGMQRAVDVTGGGLATDPDVSVVVLVDDGTASASEIFAAALQDAERARIVGTPTFGKGTVQEWTELPGETGGFRLSVSRWLTRDKEWVHGTGVQPDVLVQPGDGSFRVGSSTTGTDAQLAEAVALLMGEGVDPPGRSTPLAEGSATSGTTAAPGPDDRSEPTLSPLRSPAS